MKGQSSLNFSWSWLPLVGPSSLNSSEPEGESLIDDEALETPTPSNKPSSLLRSPPIFMLEKSFLTKAYFTILNIIRSCNSSSNNSSPLKICTFLPIKIDHKHAKKVTFPRICTHLWNGPPQLATASSAISGYSATFQTMKEKIICLAKIHFKNKHFTDPFSMHRALTQKVKVPLQQN